MQASVSALAGAAESSHLFARVETGEVKHLSEEELPLFHVGLLREADMRLLTTNAKQYDEEPHLTAVLFIRNEGGTYDELEALAKRFLNHLADTDPKFTMSEEDRYSTYPGFIHPYELLVAEIPLVHYETFDVTNTD